MARNRDPRYPRSAPAALPVQRWRAALSWLTLLWERLWPAAWPTLGLLGAYLLLALLDLLPVLPGWLHAAVMIGFAVAIGWTVWRAVRSFRLPQRHGALRRIEQVNNLSHRPLEALEDTLAPGLRDPAARSLWRLHQQRMRDLVSRLRVGWPHPRLIRHDPYALRIGLSVVLGAAFLAAGDDSASRVLRALSPDLAGMPVAAPAKLDAWITPPEYTQKAPIFLASRQASEPAAAADGTPDADQLQADLAVPKGSKLVVRVSGGRGTPQLLIDDTATAFSDSGKGAFKLETTLEKTGHVVIIQSDDEIGAWPITVIPDKAPTVSFARPPGPTQRKALRLDFESVDDYGIEQIVAKITRTDSIAVDSALAKLGPIDLELPLPAEKPRTVRSSSFHDLTPHPWAGLPVLIQLTAKDAVGQTGSSASVELVLPERVFAHPVARQIVQHRRELALHPAKSRGRVAANLEIIAWEYERYNGDPVVFLALTSASRRLGGKPADRSDELAGLLQLLWDTALRIEDGTISLSERTMREAQQALQDALNRDAGDAEIERLLRELERAMDKYFDSLAEMMRNMPQQRGEMTPMDPRSMMMNRSDIKKLLDKIRELSRSGQREAARQMLSQLRNLLENLRMRRFARPGQRHRRAMNMLNQLQDIIRRQQQLLDKTFREAQRRGQMRGPNPTRRIPRQPFPPDTRPPGEQPQAQPPPMQQEAETQESLRRRLGELMRQLGEMSGKIPRPMGRAEGAMRNSTGKLGEGQAGQAVPPQTRAIDQLQQGARAATEQLMQQLGRSGQRGQGTQPLQPSERQRDPFGRNTDNAGRGMNTEDVEVPDRDGVGNSRRIRDELRRRAGQRTRPRPELDYIERLLKQF